MPGGKEFKSNPELADKALREAQDKVLLQSTQTHAGDALAYFLANHFESKSPDCGTKVFIDEANAVSEEAWKSMKSRFTPDKTCTNCNALLLEGLCKNNDCSFSRSNIYQGTVSIVKTTLEPNDRKDLFKEVREEMQKVREDLYKIPKQPIQPSRPVDLKTAIDRLVEELRNDKTEGSYYYSWQANIAMAFKDEFESAKIGNTKDMAIVRIAHNAAKRFLDQLINVNKPIEGKKDAEGEERNEGPGNPEDMWKGNKQPRYF